ncbi:hypothetical protein GCM10027187_59430 [Streptosporangium sandarakinum]
MAGSGVEECGQPTPLQPGWFQPSIDPAYRADACWVLPCKGADESALAAVAWPATENAATKKTARAGKVRRRRTGEAPVVGSAAGKTFFKE